MLYLNIKATSFLAVAILAVPVFGQLRIVSINASNAEPAVASPRAGMNTILGAIGTTISDDPTTPGNTGIAKPIDVLCLQEWHTAATTGAGYANLLNSMYGTTTFSHGTLAGATTGAGTQGIVYNSATVQLIHEVAVGTTSSSGMPRQQVRHQLRPVGYTGTNADIYIYNGHWKASSGDQARRLVEAQTIKSNAVGLPANSNVIYLGDMNVFTSTDSGYAHLLAAGTGQAFDPISTPGNWDGSAAFRNVHTQSPWNSSLNPGFNGASGGMDSRFDQQLITGNLNDGEGVAYIPNSYFVMGNNGSHQLNQPLTTGTGAAPAVLNALASILDHLPVVADYQLPAKMSFSKSAAEPSVVIVGAAAGATVRVQNVAPTLFTNGADELDYTITTSGSAAGSFSSNTLATTPGNQHNITINTATPGVKSATVNVVSSSQQVESGTGSVGVNTTVLAHANPSFDFAAAQTVRTINFGIYGLGQAVPSQEITLNNLQHASGFTAGLDLDSINGSGDTAQLALSLATGGSPISPATSRMGTVSLSSQTIGLFSSSYILNTSDENLPGAINLSPLSVNVTGRIAIPGDATLDNTVNLDDFTALAAAFGSSGQAWQTGDFTHDGIVNLDDFTILAANFGSSAAHLPRGAVPEPAGALVAATAAALILRRRRAAL